MISIYDILKKLKAEKKLYKKKYKQVKAAFDQNPDVREGGIPAGLVLMRLLYKIEELSDKIHRIEMYYLK